MTRLHRLTLVIVAVLVIAWRGPVFTQSTASLAGVVISTDSSPQPVRQAVVTIAGGGLAQSRSVVTDDGGRFAFENLPAGRFTVSASKRAFLTNAYGATRPGRPGTPVTVASGQRVTDIRMVLPRGAVITGAVRDRSGQPAEGIAVAAQSLPMPRNDTGVLVRPETVTTDDRGVYRIFGLAPGEYVVYATFRFSITSEMSVPSEADVDAALRQLKQAPGKAESLPRTRPVAYAPTFHPGVARIAEAARVVVTTGEERGAVDITLEAAPTAKIEGTVVNASGPLPVGISVSIDSDAQFGDFSMLGLSGSSVGADGRFTFRGVTPGTYTITNRAGGRGSPGDGGLFARATVDVNGVDIAGLTLTLRPLFRVSGKVVLDSAAAKPPNTSYRVLLRPDSGSQERILNSTVAGTVGPDGSFTVSNVMPGRYVVDVPIAGATRWLLHSAILGGRDFSDAGLEIGESDVSGLTITVTDVLAELSGTLMTATGAPATDLSVVLIPADRALWRFNPRRMKVARPSTDGRYIVGELPAGEYLLSTVTEIDVEDLKDAALLEKLATGAVKVTLAEGERKVQDLRMGR